MSSSFTVPTVGGFGGTFRPPGTSTFGLPSRSGATSAAVGSTFGGSSGRHPLSPTEAVSSLCRDPSLPSHATPRSTTVSGSVSTLANSALSPVRCDKCKYAPFPDTVHRCYEGIPPSTPFTCGSGSGGLANVSSLSSSTHPPNESRFNRRMHVVPTEQQRFRPETIAPTGNGRFGGTGRGRAALPPVKNHDNREFAVEMDYHTHFDDDEQNENAPAVEHHYIPEGLNIDGALLLEQDQMARGDQRERTGIHFAEQCAKNVEICSTTEAGKIANTGKDFKWLKDYSKIPDYLSFDIREEIRPLIEKLTDTISLRMLMKTPYPIQSACFPIILSKRDVLILSPSGTGKTAAYGVPIVCRVLDMLADPSIGYQIECDKAATHGGKSCMPLALIVCPTRELCMQLLYEIRRFTGLRTRMLLTVACTVLQLVTRGHTISDQSAHILICTPGRLRHFVCSDRIVDLSLCRLLVLEECDKLLEADFSSELRETFENGRMPNVVTEGNMLDAFALQTIMVTAQLPRRLSAIADRWLEPNLTVVVREVDAGLVNKIVKQVFLQVGKISDKQELLKNYICENYANELRAVTGKDELETNHFVKRTIVFFNSKAFLADFHMSAFKEHPLIATCHGDMSQRDRETMWQKFVWGKRPILFASDLMSHGIDVQHLNVVINFDMPFDFCTYVARVGRCGRAGHPGTAYSYVSIAGDRYDDNHVIPALVLNLRDAGLEPEQFLLDLAEQQQRTNDDYMSPTSMLKPFEQLYPFAYLRPNNC